MLDEMFIIIPMYTPRAAQGLVLLIPLSCTDAGINKYTQYDEELTGLFYTRRISFTVIYNSDNNIELSFYPGLNIFHFRLSEWQQSGNFNNPL